MHTKQIGENLLLVDLQTGGFENLIASYILKGTQTTIFETGPTSSIPNLISGLEEAKVKPEDVAYVARASTSTTAAAWARYSRVCRTLK